MVICGGCRDKEDVQRAEDLQLYAKEMGLTEDDLEWALNVSVDKLASLLEVIPIIFPILREFIENKLTLSLNTYN